MKKKMGATGIIIAGILMLTGCGQKIPEMSDAQSQQVTEYAASLLMRYDQNNPSRLLSDVALETELARLQVMAEKKAFIQAQEQARKEKEESDKAEREKAIQDATLSGNNQEVVTPQYIEEFYNIEGFQIRYQGYQVLASYPDAAESEYFSMSAPIGNKLVVFEFQVTNITGEEKELDMISVDPKFTVSFNEQGAKSALTTLLLDDMANFRGSIPASENVKLVIVAQVSDADAENISSIAIKMKNDSTSATTYTE